MIKQGISEIALSRSLHEVSWSRFIELVGIDTRRVYKSARRGLPIGSRAFCSDWGNEESATHCVSLTFPHEPSGSSIPKDPIIRFGILLEG